MERFFINQRNNESVIVGGVRLLLEVSAETVLISVAGSRVEISGERLKIARFDENEICVTGKIGGVVTHGR